MSVRIILKNSPATGTQPTTQDLALGELAINTTDGVIFFKQSNGVSESIQRLSASGSATASYALQSLSSSYAATASFLLGSISSASFATTAATASFTPNAIVTASVNSNTITFTKGNGSTFALTVNTGSGGGGGGASDFPFTGSAIISGSLVVTGSIRATQGVTASLFGTASWALNTISSSYALSASFAEGSMNTQDVLIYVKNTTGQQIDKGKVVRISGATGDNALIALADWTNDTNSANTLGLTNQNIPDQAFGYVMTEGKLLGIDTSLYTAGQLLFLAQSGSMTGSAPLAPLHGVRLGQVLRVQQNNGSMYVRIDNGYELDELHDVRITSPVTGQALVRSGSIWINSSITASATPNALVTASVSQNTITFTKGDGTTFPITVNTGSGGGGGGGATFPFTGSAIISGSLAITGSLGVSSSLTLTGSVDVTGSFRVTTGGPDQLVVNSTGVNIGNFATDRHSLTGSLRVFGNVTASLFGTASWALTARTASFLTAGTYAITASQAISSSLARTASFALSNVVTASISSSVITFTRGDATTFPIAVSTTIHMNPSASQTTGTGNTNLYTHDLPANTLSTDNSSITIVAQFYQDNDLFGPTYAQGNTYFSVSGSDIAAVGIGNTNSRTWAHYNVTIIRVSLTSIKYVIWYGSNVDTNQRLLLGSNYNVITQTVSNLSTSPLNLLFYGSTTNATYPVIGVAMYVQRN